ncbi:MAG: hypothetical protein HY726_09635 [Candidatus Rokubacteria bacterium]|nr:hypothetical protein [Candidatus Rokubacteria bacterium]
MKRSFPPRYFLASIALLLVVVTLYAASAARRTQRELLKQTEEKALALAEVLEVTSRNAIQGNAVLEELIGQRLLDNARLIDQLLLSRPFDRAALAQLAAMNRLQRVDLLDREGRPYEPPSPPRGMMGMMMPPQWAGEATEFHRSMMLYMWGRRWALPREEAAPPAVKDRKFWEGSLFGVAVGARSFPGIIAVHADANYILNFRKEIGVQRQIEELGRQPGIESVALLGRDLAVLAHSQAERVGQRDADDAGRAALAERQTVTRLMRGADGSGVLEVLKPVALDGNTHGLLRISLSTASMDRVWRRDLGFAVALALAVLAAGALGLAVIFYIQHRHLKEVRALEDEMGRRERLATLGNMAAAVAHEIRNPLNVISVGLQRLRAEFRPATEAGEYGRFVALMEDEVARLNRTVEEFLSLARPLPLKPERLRISELLTELGTLVEGEARTAGVRLVLSVPPDLPPIAADRDYLKRVVLNLLLNGLQAMPEGGTLSLEARATGDTLTLTVTDTGAGIPPESLPRIFDPYFTTKTKGLGLGLAIARRIVEAHGGQIEVESRPERGSLFRVLLPLEPRAVPA